MNTILPSALALQVQNLSKQLLKKQGVVQELQAERTQLKIKLLHQQQIITKVFP